VLEGARSAKGLCSNGSIRVKCGEKRRHLGPILPPYEEVSMLKGHRALCCDCCHLCRGYGLNTRNGILLALLPLTFFYMHGNLHIYPYLLIQQCKQSEHQSLNRPPPHPKPKLHKPPHYTTYDAALRDPTRRSSNGRPERRPRRSNHQNTFNHLHHAPRCH
jgi:hypothetical protein